MEIQKSTFKKMYELSQSEKEGLVMLGAGGDLQEWVNGIEDLLVNEEIVNSAVFTFEEAHQLKTTGGRTDLVLIFDASKINISRLAMWRIKFGDCSWLSDYTYNYAEYHGYDVSEHGIPWSKVDVMEY